ncbi:hypothetical protein [Agarivorans sp. DSG3-1]|uniref:hypothetical protein n=1 Tax=Agarivorans sp. DSG3-1 TaxID=3342249 RepID=UPI00398E3B65
MIIQQTLNKGEIAQQSGDGKFIYLREANAPVELLINNRIRQTLRLRETMEMPQGQTVTSVRVESLGTEPNPIVLESSEALIHQANDGQLMEVTNFPAFPQVQNVAQHGDWSMKIDQMPSVAINNFPSIQSVAQSGAWEVAVINLPNVQKVSQSGAWTMEVSNFPSVQNVAPSGEWPVTISQLLNVSVDNFPSVYASSQSGAWSVEVTALPSVTIDNFPALQQVEITNLPAANDSLSTGVVEVTAGAGSITANAGRDVIKLKAATTNTAAILLGDWPLEAGETLELETVAAINFTGTDLDKLYFIEVA